MLNKIVVALASDQNYFDGLLVTAGSMARCACQDSDIEWVVLDGGIEECSFRLLEESLLRLHGRSEIRRIIFDKEHISNAPEYNGSIMTYSRLLLSKLLPEVEFVLYCDVDFLWRADVAELWKLRCDKYILQSTHDQNVMLNGGRGEETWFRKHNFCFDKDRYFCAGLCLFNLKLIRDEGYDKIFLDALLTNNNLPLADQTVLNAYVPSCKIGFLPDRWQIFVTILKSEQTKHPFVLHYAASAPWKNMWLFSDSKMLWYKELARISQCSLTSVIGKYNKIGFAFFLRFLYLVVTSNRYFFFVFRSLMRLINREGTCGYCCRIYNCEQLFNRKML